MYGREVDDLRMTTSAGVRQMLTRRLLVTLAFTLLVAPTARAQSSQMPFNARRYPGQTKSARFFRRAIQVNHLATLPMLVFKSDAG